MYVVVLSIVCTMCYIYYIIKHYMLVINNRAILKIDIFCILPFFMNKH